MNITMATRTIDLLDKLEQVLREFPVASPFHTYAAKGHDLTYLHNGVTMGDGLILRAHLKRFEVC